MEVFNIYIHSVGQYNQTTPPAGGHVYYGAGDVSSDGMWRHYPLTHFSKALLVNQVHNQL